MTNRNANILAVFIAIVGCALMIFDVMYLSKSIQLIKTAEQNTEVVEKTPYKVLDNAYHVNVDDNSCSMIYYDNVTHDIIIETINIKESALNCNTMQLRLMSPTNDYVEINLLDLFETNEINQVSVVTTSNCHNHENFTNAK